MAAGVTKKPTRKAATTLSTGVLGSGSIASKVIKSAMGSMAEAATKKLIGQSNLNLFKNVTGSMITDPFEFLKKSWAGISQLPSSMAPTFDLEELDKRITDMKAVESWLQMNLSMLQGTIKGLEIQRGTLATIKDLGSSLTPATASGLAKDLASGMKETATHQNANAWWEMLQTQFAQVTQAAAATMSQATSAATHVVSKAASSAVKPSNNAKKSRKTASGKSTSKTASKRVAPKNAKA